MISAATETYGRLVTIARRARQLIDPGSNVTGVVTAVGAEVGGIEPGDKVLFPRVAGYDVRLAGAAVKVLRRGELIARVHD